MATTNTFFIHFMDGYVSNDGDAFSQGEIFFAFKVDDDIIAFEPPQSAQGVNSGGWLVVNGDRLITRTSDESFTISGTVKEDDDFLTGDVDNAGSFSATYSGANGWWPGATPGTSKTFSHRLRGDGLDVTISYSINLVSSAAIVILPPLPDPVPDPNAFGGVIVYQNVNYNGSGSSNNGGMLTMPVRSQFFPEGEYDLPHMGEVLPFLFLNIIYPNSISSVKVATGYSVVFFDKPLSERASGRSLLINASVPELEAEWNDKIMSFIVTSDRVQ